ncbi:MAG: hypothetical protein IKV41_07185 [Oscillospiraceae bacterium]|nr:hypothetical protein [Oscillospiraceae bacterium]
MMKKIISVFIVLIVIFTISGCSIKNKSEKRLSQEQIELLAETLAGFNYSPDREERLKTVSSIIPENVAEKLMYDSESYREYIDYFPGNIAVKIWDIKPYNSDEKVLIRVRYMECSKFNEAMTTIIILKFNEGVEDAEIYDFFNHIPEQRPAYGYNL